MLARSRWSKATSEFVPNGWIVEIYDFQEVRNLICMFPLTKQKRKASYVLGNIGVRNHLCRLHLSTELAVCQREAILTPSERCTRDELGRMSCIKEANRSTCRVQVWSQLIINVLYRWDYSSASLWNEVSTAQRNTKWDSRTHYTFCSY